MSGAVIAGKGKKDYRVNLILAIGALENTKYSKTARYLFNGKPGWIY